MRFVHRLVRCPLLAARPNRALWIWLGLWLLAYAFALVALRQRIALRCLPGERRVLWLLLLLLAAANWGYLIIQRI